MINKIDKHCWVFKLGPLSITKLPFFFTIWWGGERSPKQLEKDLNLSIRYP